MVSKFYPLEFYGQDIKGVVGDPKSPQHRDDSVVCKMQTCLAIQAKAQLLVDVNCLGIFHALCRNTSD